MKRFYVLFLVLAASFGNLQAMGPSNTFKLTAEEDGTTFFVPRSIAMQVE